MPAFEGRLPRTLTFFTIGSSGLAFRNDGTFENLDGFFYLNEDIDAPAKLAGTQSRYKVTDDSISMFNPAIKEWYGFKIIKLTADSLILKHGDGGIKYSRYKPFKGKNPEIDQIIFASTSCFGACPQMSIAISRNGDVVFVGDSFVTKEGIYYGKADKATLNNLFSLINRINIDSLKTDYDHDATDMAFYYTLFSNGNRIYKSVKDYGADGPNGLVWAYSEMQTLYQRLALKKAVLPYYLLKIATTSGIQLIDGDRRLDINEAEALYLFCKLKSGIASSKTHHLPYSLKSSGSKNDHNFNVRTDGQFYEFSKENGQKVATIDIGFNFLAQKLNIPHWRQKTEYDAP